MNAESTPLRGSAIPWPGLTTGKLTRTQGNLHLPAKSRLINRQYEAPQPTASNAIFLDRDGVLNEEIGYLRRPEQLRILPGVAEAIQSLLRSFYIIVVTNQAGIARGLFTEEDLLVIHSHLLQKLESQGAVVDAFYYCPHHIEGTVPTYKVECECRKPKPGMLLRAQNDWSINLPGSYLVGDTPRDIEAGQAAGVRSILLADSPGPSPLFAADLPQAAAQILKDTEANQAIDSPDTNQPGTSSKRGLAGWPTTS